MVSQTRWVTSIHEHGFWMPLRATSATFRAAPVVASATQSLMPSLPVTVNAIFLESSDHSVCEILAPAAVWTRVSVVPPRGRTTRPRAHDSRHAPFVLGLARLPAGRRY